VVIFFDIETTGFEDPDIVQISAVTSWNNSFSSYNKYIIPKKPISENATRVHGLRTRLEPRGYWPGAGPTYVIYRDERRLDCYYPNEALNGFVKFCNKFHRTKWGYRPDTRVYLCAYNGRAFDGIILKKSFEKYKVCFEESNFGLVDPLINIRKWDWKDKGLVPNNKLSSIAKYLNIKYDDNKAHNSVYDSKILLSVMEALIKKIRIVSQGIHLSSIQEFAEKTAINFNNIGTTRIP